MVSNGLTKETRLFTAGWNKISKARGTPCRLKRILRRKATRLSIYISSSSTIDQILELHYAPHIPKLS